MVYIPGKGYLPELFRQIKTYLPELIRQIRTYLPELFRQIRTDLPELFWQISSYFFGSRKIPGQKLKIDPIWGVPTNEVLFAGTVLANKFLFAGIVPANKFLFAGRVPANNLFLYGMYIKTNCSKNIIYLLFTHLPYLHTLYIYKRLIYLEIVYWEHSPVYYTRKLFPWKRRRQKIIRMVNLNES